MNQGSDFQGIDPNITIAIVTSPHLQPPKTVILDVSIQAVRGWACIELYRNASYSAKDVLIFQMNQLAHPSPVFLIKSLPTWPNGNHSPEVRPRLPCPPLVRHWAQRGMQSPGPPVGTRTPFMDVQKAAPRQAWPQPQSTPGSPHG